MTMNSIDRGAGGLLGVAKPQSEGVTLPGDRPGGRAGGGDRRMETRHLTNERLLSDYQVNNERHGGLSQ